MLVLTFSMVISSIYNDTNEFRFNCLMEFRLGMDVRNGANVKKNVLVQRLNYRKGCTISSTKLNNIVKM